MVAISSTLVNPANLPVANVEVELELTDGTGREVRGWYGEDEVVSRIVTTTDTQGNWSTNILANADILPANTAYKVTERYDTGYRHSYLFIASEGMTSPAQGLVDSLDPLQAAAFQLHVADETLHAAGNPTPISGATPKPLGVGAPGSTGQVSDAGHVHPTTGVALSTHDHNNTYYTEGEVDTLLAGKSSVGHTHTHDHNALYYTETEINTLLSNKAGLDHTHASGGEGGVSDHGALAGLGDDDHPQYALSDGSRGAFAEPNHTHSGLEASTELAVKDNALPPGFYFEFPATVSKIVTLVGTAPQGSNLIVELVDGETVIGTVTTQAGQNIGVLDEVDYAVAAGDILQANIVQVGSTDPGKDLAVYIIDEEGITSGAGTMAGLSDVDLTNLADGNVLVYNAASTVWLPSEPPSGSGSVSVEDLTNLDTSGVDDGYIIVYDVDLGSWIVQPAPSGIGDHTDADHSFASEAHTHTVASLPSTMAHELTQQNPGDPFPTRPAGIPNGGCSWNLYDKPDGTLGAMSNDKIFNISGTAWS